MSLDPLHTARKAAHMLFIYALTKLHWYLCRSVWPTSSELWPLVSQKLQSTSCTGGKHGAWLKRERRRRLMKVALVTPKIGCIASCFLITLALDKAMEMIRKSNQSQGMCSIGVY